MPTALDQLAEVTEKIGNRVSELEAGFGYIDTVFNSISVIAGVIAVMLAAITIIASVATIYYAGAMKDSKKQSEKIGAETKAFQEQVRDSIQQKIDELDTKQTQITTAQDEFLSTSSDLITARVLYRAADFATASRFYAQAHEIIPENPEVVYYLGRSYTYCDEIDKAQQVFKTILEKEESARIYRGLAYSKRFSDPEDALNDIMKALTLTSLDQDRSLFVNLLNDQGILLRDLGKQSDAKDVHEKAIDYDPHNPVSRFFNGLCIGADRRRRTKALDEIRLAATYAKQEKSRARIKEIWLEVILWAEFCFDHHEDALDQCVSKWKLIYDNSNSEYMKETHKCNAEALSKVLGIDRTKIAPI